MKRKNILLHALLLIAAGCTIIQDEYLNELPADVKVAKIELGYGPSYLSVSGAEWKLLNADIVYSANQAVINWPQGVDIFFYDKDASKTVYQLNSNGLAEKVTTTFTDGTIMEDVLTYNANKQVVELTNSFFKDNLKFFYKNYVIDSVVKTRTVNSVTQTGFYKRVSATAMISIFPYDNTKPYTLTLSDGSGCSSGSSLPANMNTFNKTEYLNIPSEYDNQFNLDRSVKINYKVNTTASNYYEKYFHDDIYGYTNYFQQPSNYYFYSYECAGGFGNVNNGYINIYRLLPTLVPDFLSLYQLTAENELEWIVKNTAKENADWQLREISYGYEPASK